ncbi:GNAT family N-acetyltransferase [Kribbella sp. NBC_01245]|uniref:GNAT family N-acetyltransferase n=1 Tax=Kribbella sp. NBC_01245 TaxID=2903578 RepID=UPI002E2A72D1|nr:GNAT family N-acetyltransferase [Kribbella sp. NBC_01245]
MDPFDSCAFGDWYDALATGARADREAPVVSTLKALAFSLQNPGERLRRLAVAAVEDGQTVGAMLFELPLVDNLTNVSVEIDVPPAHRRKGVATALWAWAVERAAAEQRTIVQTEINVPRGFGLDEWPGAVFAAKLGLVSENTEDHFVTRLPFDAETYSLLKAKAPALTSYRLISWAGSCPEEQLQAYAELHSAMERDVPSGGLTREASVWDAERVRKSEARLAESYLSLVTLAQTLDGEPAGYTLIYVPLDDPANVLQDDTLVLREHRGNNLGTHLKLANLDQLAAAQDHHGWLHTWTSDENGPMQKVNARFGFRPVEQMHEFEGTI